MEKAQEGLSKPPTARRWGPEMVKTIQALWVRNLGCPPVTPMPPLWSSLPPNLQRELGGVRDGSGFISLSHLRPGAKQHSALGYLFAQLIRD